MLKLEYEGHDYKHEPLSNNQVQDSPINLGLVFKANELGRLHAAVLRRRALHPWVNWWLMR